MPRYVILTPNLFADRDWTRFGCDIFQGAGFDILPLQLPHLLGVGVEEISRANFTPISSARMIETLRELRAVLDTLNDTDLILVEFRLSAATVWLFHELARRKLAYFFVDLALVPWRAGPEWRAVFMSEFARLKIGGFVDRVRSIISVLHLMTARSIDHANLTAPWLWVTAGRPDILKHLRAPKRFAVPRLRVPSRDWLCVQTAKRSDDSQFAKADEPYAVFMDEAFADHPDFRLMGRKSPVDTIRYWSALERFFDRLERATSLRVIVAPHPKSSGSFPANIARRVSSEMTSVNLVRDCKLMLAHCSTSIGMGVAFGRPIMLLTTDDIERSMYGAHIAQFCTWLGRRRLNVDHPESWGHLAVPTVNEKTYRRYVRRFMYDGQAQSFDDIWPAVIAAHHRRCELLPRKTLAALA